MLFPNTAALEIFDTRFRPSALLMWNFSRLGVGAVHESSSAHSRVLRKGHARSRVLRGRLDSARTARTLLPRFFLSVYCDSRLPGMHVWQLATLHVDRLAFWL
jgi:hypothetical protein